MQSIQLAVFILFDRGYTGIAQNFIFYTTSPPVVLNGCIVFVVWEDHTKSDIENTNKKVRGF